MATTHPSRIFASGNATTLHVTILMQIVSDSRFPLRTDDDVTITIDSDRLGVTGTNEGINE